MSTCNIKIQCRLINTTVVSTQTMLQENLRHLLYSLDKEKGVRRVVGLDIEQGDQEIHLLKLASSSICLLIQLHRFSPHTLPSELSKFLQLSTITFVGIGIKYSLEALERLYRLRCRNFLDVRSLAASVKDDNKFRGYGLEELAYWVCGINDACVKKPEDVAFSDWAAISLSNAQLKSATADAYLPFYIGNHLLEGSTPAGYGFHAYGSSSFPRTRYLD